MSEQNRIIRITTEYNTQEFPYDKSLLFYVNMYNRRLTVGGLEPIPCPPTSKLVIEIIEKENVEKPKKQKKRKQLVETGNTAIAEKIRGAVANQEQDPQVSSSVDEPPAKKNKQEHTLSYSDMYRPYYNKLKEYMQSTYNLKYPHPYTPANVTDLHQILFQKIGEKYPPGSRAKPYHDFRATIDSLKQALKMSV